MGEALAAGLEPVVDLPSTDLVRVSLYLSSDWAAQLQHVAKLKHLTLEKAVAGLAYARFRQRTTGAVAHLEQPEQRTIDADLCKASASGGESREEGQDNRATLQARLRIPLMEGLRAEKIVFAEGGTGLGKSRVIAQCALEYLGGDPRSKVLVLAPTISVLVHLVREFKEVAPSDFDAFSVVLGRSQFVSSKRLESMLGLPCPDSALASSWDAAVSWLGTGGQSPDRPANGFAHEFSLCWLAEELRRVAPQFPVDDVLLGGADEGDAADPAQIAYQNLRLRAFDEEIKLVFATQAMACLNVWSLLRPDRQPGILPSFDLILIDEAHALEEVMAQTIGSSVSLLHMRQVLRQGLEQSTWQKFRLATAAKRTLSHLDRAEQVLREIPDAGLISSWSDSVPEQTGRKQTFEKFLSVVRDLDDSLKTLADFHNESASDIPVRLLREWHQALGQMLDGRQNIWLDFSPVVRTPRLTVGPTQLIRPFEELWQSCRAAGLLSGTLYLPDSHDRLSSAFLRMKLRVPLERALEINPVHPAWNFTSPTIYLPNEVAAKDLTYPGTADDETGATDVHHWHEALAKRLLEVSTTARGGILVLCCSYLDIRAISALLTDALGERLLSSSGGSSLRPLSEAFIQLGRKKARPVWLATGSAWTGLDLADRETFDPDQDTLLTDLVITRVPFGTNKTAVHMSRIKRMGFDVEAMETALRLKQGLGRLIRREGVTGRRIWMMDGRSLGRRSSYFKRVFGPVFAYPHRETFT